MNQGEKVDQDAVLRARTTLLASDGPSVAQQVEAYRVLSAVSPLTYLPKLARALVSYGYEPEVRDLPEARLARYAQAVDVARRIDEGAPNRKEVLLRALDAYRFDLYAQGRRAEGFAVCEEMAELGQWGFERGQVRIPVNGHGRLAVVLAEEGRYGEAAEMWGRAVDAERRSTPRADSFWPVVEWVAALDAAGRREEALDAFAELVEGTRGDATAGRGTSAVQIWQLVHQAGMSDAVGRHAEARASRREALALLAGREPSGKPTTWSGVLEWWVALFTLSGRQAEPVPTADAPGPAFGVALHQWSPDVREAYLGGLGPLEAELTALRQDPSVPLPELMALQRRVTVRTAVHQERHHHRLPKPLRPLLDEGVALARRLAERDVLGRALTDRAMFLVGVERHGEAYDDLREACDLLDR
jgi:tetratricopeptide (TPR) repeat protein